MTSTVFTTGTVIEAPWLNDVNKLTYNKTFADGTVALSAAPGSLLDAFDVSYEPAGTGAVATNVQAKLRQTVSVKDFGAVGDGVTNDTAAIQAAINANLNGGEIYFPPGTYKITSTLSKPQSFVGPSLIGAGWDCTTFNYSTITAGTPCLYIQGGSGALSSITIEGIAFQGRNDGSTGTTGIFIDGQCGVLINRCRFLTNYFGIEFFNKTLGSFTEFCVADYCDFTEACSVKIRYGKTSGNNSFNGSGARNCTMSCNGTNQVIVVENGCLVYNAPLSGQIWSNSTTGLTIIKNNNTGTLNCNWYGNLTLEAFGSTSAFNLAVDGARTYYVGSINSINQYWNQGTAVVCDMFSGDTNGAVYVYKKPWSVRKICTTGTTSIDLELPYADEYSKSGIVSSFTARVTLIGVNYVYQYVLLFTPSIVGTPTAFVTVLQTGDQFNTAGWGASTFGVGGTAGDPTLTVTNASVGFNVTTTVALSQIGYYTPQ
jgi:hypothetical protein